MKRIAIVVFSLFAFVSASAFAKGPGGVTAFGVYGSFISSTTGTTSGSSLGLTAKFGSFPVLGLQYLISSNPRLGMSCDYYIIDSARIGGIFTYFVGAGLYGGFAFGDSTAFDFGLRVPVGIQAWLVKKIELYLAGVPMIPLVPQPGFNFGAELGFRVHF